MIVILWLRIYYMCNFYFINFEFEKLTIANIILQTAMKKFILRKLLMLIYFLDRAKEQQLIRHNPCLFKGDSQYKVSM